MERPYDLIVFGATGFTGRLVAEQLQQHHAGPLRWALAGRNLDKLERLRAELGGDVALLLADASDAAALRALVVQAQVVITTVGPYQLHGEALVRACADAGTDYVDLCGEPLWMAQMVAQLQRPAERSGARICFSCGFDSIPFDLGVVYLQHEAQRRLGAPLQRVRGRVRRVNGAASGGTVASLLATLDAIGGDATLTRQLADPFALTPGFRGPAQPDGEAAAYDELAQAWTGPFMMAMINTKNVHRTNFLRGHPWGRDFEYDERLLCGDGDAGRLRAMALALGSRAGQGVLSFAPTRALLRGFAFPRPGNGPSAAQRKAGGYELLFTGQGEDGTVLSARVAGEGDPGYASTSRMIVQAALGLLDDRGRLHAGGGVWTPGAAMGLALVRRLQAHAGVSFSLDD